MPSIPDNPATSLERIFTRVRESRQSSAMAVWAHVLNAQASTPEFALRHAEVVFLVRRLELYILALPEEDSTRERYVGDIGTWYTAVGHTGNWTSDSNAYLNMIDEDNVRLLGSLGEILSLRASRDQPGDKPDVEALRASLADWRSLLDDAVLPTNLVAAIRQQVDQIEFLLGEVEIYGYEPLADHGRTLFSLGFSVIKVAGVAGKIGTAMSGVFQFITQVGMKDYGTAATTFAGLLTSADELFAVASAERHQPAIEAKPKKAIEAGPQKELESGEGDPPASPTPDEKE